MTSSDPGIALAATVTNVSKPMHPTTKFSTKLTPHVASIAGLRPGSHPFRYLRGSRSDRETGHARRSDGSMQCEDP